MSFVRDPTNAFFLFCNEECLPCFPNVKSLFLSLARDTTRRFSKRRGVTAVAAATSISESDSVRKCRCRWHHFLLRPASNARAWKRRVSLMSLFFLCRSPRQPRQLRGSRSLAPSPDASRSTAAPRRNDRIFQNAPLLSRCVRPRHPSQFWSPSLTSLEKVELGEANPFNHFDCTTVLAIAYQPSEEV